MYPITISLTITDKAQLDAIYAAVAGTQAQTVALQPVVKQAKAEAPKVEPQPEPKAEAPKVEVEPRPEPKAEAPKEAPAQSSTNSASEEVDEKTAYQNTAKAVTEVAKKFGREKALEILQKVKPGASKLPDIPPQQYAAVVSLCMDAIKAAE